MTIENTLERIAVALEKVADQSVKQTAIMEFTFSGGEKHKQQDKTPAKKVTKKTTKAKKEMTTKEAVAEELKVYDLNAPEPGVAPPPPPAEEVEASTEVEKPALTIEELNVEMVKHAKANGLNKAALLAVMAAPPFNATSVLELDAEQYRPLLLAIQGLK